MGHTVIGQTGSVVLSDAHINRQQAKKRTLRYRYVKCRHGYRAEVIGPFHSAIYGTCSFGTTRARSKASLETTLANNHSYFGHLLISDVDESDTVGIVDRRLLDYNPILGPVTARAMIA